MKIIITILLACFACSQPPSGKRTVVVSLPPYAYFVEKIAGERIKVEVLVPPGSNPHIYEPSPKQIQNVAHAAVWLRSGDPFENKLVSVLREQSPELEIVDLTEGISLLGGHDEEEADLHVWLDPRIAERQIRVIGQVLMDRFPEERAVFEEGLKAALEEVEALDEEIGKELKPFAGDSILVSHPAFGYFCEAYGLKQLSIEHEGKDPLPRDIEETLQEAKTAHVQAVFTQIQYSNKGAELIAEKLDLPVYEVDPYSREYSKMMHELADRIAHAPGH